MSKRKKVNHALTALTNSEIEKSNDFYHKTYGKSSELDPFMYQSSNDISSDEKSDDESANDYNLSNNKKRPKISIKRGEFQFEVKNLRNRTKEKGIQREDGLPYDPLAEDEGGFFEDKWREEQYERQKILQRDPNYKFIQLIAGFSNADVEVLYEEQDLISIFRRERAISQQQKIAIDEIKINRENIKDDINRLTKEIKKLRGNIIESKDKIILIDLLNNENPKSYFKLFNLLEEKNSYEIIKEIREIVEKLSGQTLGFSDLELNDKKKFLSDYNFIVNKFKLTKNKTVKKLIEELENRLSKPIKKKIIKPKHVKELFKFIALIVYLQYNKLTIKDISDEDEDEDLIDFYNINNDKYIDSIKSKIESSEIIFFDRLLSIIRFIDKNENLLRVTPTDFYQASNNELLKADMFQRYRYENILKSYGEYIYINTSKNFKEKKEFKILSYYTTQYIYIKDEVDAYINIKRNEIISQLEQIQKKSERIPQTDKFKQRTLTNLQSKLTTEKERIDSFIEGKFVSVFTVILLTYKFYLVTELNKNIKNENNYRKYLERSEERLNKLSTGEIEFHDLPKVAYTHRRGWVESPENSGVVKLKPIVVSSIEVAFVFIKTKIDWTSKIELEELQQNEGIRSSFSLLVALEMAKIVLRFPKQYLQLKLREFTLKDKIDAASTIKNHFTSFYNQNTKKNEIKFLTSNEKRQSNNNRDLNSFIRKSIGFTY